MCVARLGDRREEGGQGGRDLSNFRNTRALGSVELSTVSIYLSIYLALFFIRALPPALAVLASPLNSTPFPACAVVSLLFLLERRFYWIIPDFSISRIPRRYFPEMRI